MDEFRDPQLAANLLDEIRRETSSDKQITLMEVCGTHTMSISQNGIRSLLPENIRLLSGPGCPVCVTPNDYLDLAIAYGRQPDVILTTFGDMVRVPGSYSSLERERAAGADIRVVYSTMDALEIAARNPKAMVVFLAVGFETTAPTVAAAIIEVKRRNLNNFTILCAHKLVPPAMEALLNTPEISLDGFICPAHVSAIIGTRSYESLAERYEIPCVVTGFEPLDVLQGILMLVRQVLLGEHRAEIQYRRVVTPEGNPAAQALLHQIFSPCDSTWRGLGNIPASGLRLRDSHRDMDITYRREVSLEPAVEDGRCRCGDVLRGLISPSECTLFGRVCRPDAPVGACMVSSEGSCAAYYKYDNRPSVSWDSVQC
jgi:hydrogenase expression/formation protein HypD